MPINSIFHSHWYPQLLAYKVCCRSRPLCVAIIYFYIVVSETSLTFINALEKLEKVSREGLRLLLPQPAAQWSYSYTSITD